MIRSNMCDDSYPYTLVTGTITIDKGGDNYAAKRADETDKKVICKNCAIFIEYFSNIDNTQIYNAKDVDVVMTMYNLIEYGDNYLKTLRQYYRDESSDQLLNCESFESKIKIT